MITHSFMLFINGFIQIVLAYRPSWQPTLPPAVSQFVAFDLAYDRLLPINECLTCATFAISLMLAMVTTKWWVKIADWIADVIP